MVSNQEMEARVVGFVPNRTHTHTHTSMVQNKKIVRRCDLANREYFTHYGMAKYFAPWVKLLY